MKNTIFVIMMIVNLFFLSSCKTKKEISIVNLTPAKIHLSKFACLGKCEVYTLNISEKKKAIFNGRKNVYPLGKYQTTIDEEEYQSILYFFEKGKFKKLKSEYLSPYTDLPKIKIEYDGYSISFHKRVAPVELTKILNKLEQLTNRTNWK